MKEQKLVIRNVMDEYFASVDKTNFPSPEQVCDDIIVRICNAFAIHNAAESVEHIWYVPCDFTSDHIAYIFQHVYRIVLIDTGTMEQNLPLGIYMPSGTYQGVYITDDELIYKLIHFYRPSATMAFCRRVINSLRNTSPVVKSCQESNLIPVNNGIFDYKTKQLLPFTPDLVFMSKSRVDYNPNATNIIIHDDEDGTDWDVESWMLKLVDGDEKKADLLWQVVGATVRPLEPWNCACFLYSKSYWYVKIKEMVLELFHRLVGDYSSCSLAGCKNMKSLANFPKCTLVSVMLGSNSIEMENICLDEIKYLKQVVTGEPINIYGKVMRFRGFTVQFVAGEPYVKDTSDLFFRNQLYIPIADTFTCDELYKIANDYIRRTDVLEYVLYKVLHMDYDSFTASDKRNNTLKVYGSFNDYVCQFMEEIMPRLQWDLVPFTFLYDLYNAWYEKNVGDKNTKSKQAFKTYFLSFLPKFTDWYYEDKPYRPKDMMDKPESLIAEYELEDWYNPNYNGNDINKICKPLLKEKYRGIVRA